MAHLTAEHEPELETHFAPQLIRQNGVLDRTSLRRTRTVSSERSPRTAFQAPSSSAIPPGQAPAADTATVDAAGRTVTLTHPVTAETPGALRHRVRRASRLWELPGEVEDALCLIVTELATNVFLHSGGSRITMTVTLSDRAVSVQIEDTGRWKPREGIRRAVKDENVSCGRGLALVNACADRFSVLAAPGGTHVLAEVELPAPEAVPAAA